VSQKVQSCAREEKEMIFMRHLGVKMRDKEIQINEKVNSLNNHSTSVPTPWEHTMLYKGINENSEVSSLPQIHFGMPFCGSRP